jgi:hypothetical protein
MIAAQQQIVYVSDQKQQIRSIIILCQFHFQLTLYCKQCEHYTPSKSSHKLWQIIVCYPWKTTKPSWRQKVEKVWVVVLSYSNIELKTY